MPPILTQEEKRQMEDEAREDSWLAREEARRVLRQVLAKLGIRMSYVTDTKAKRISKGG